MALLTSSWFIDVLLLLFTLLFMLYRYLAAKYSYFSSRGIPYFNNSIRERFSQPGVHTFRNAYAKMKDERFFGQYFFTYPAVVIKDPELAHRILVKDFNHFYDRGMPNLTDDFLLSQSLFNLNGQAWRSLRNKLLPTFTSGKMKYMFSQFLNCGDHFLEDIKNSAIDQTPFDGKAITTDYAIEVVASTAFGINLSKNNPQSAELASRLTNLFIPPNYKQIILFFLVILFPSLKKLVKISACSPGSEEYFVTLTKATKKFRKENKINRNDYFQLLLALQEADEKGKNAVLDPNEGMTDEDKMLDQMQYALETSQSKADDLVFNDELLCAQVLIFMNAGTENISFTVTMALYHIAKDTEIQTRLRDEIDATTAKQGTWTYQGVKDMVYMDQVLQETLRMYPLLPGVLRECMAPYQIPGSDVVLEKGTRVFIPIADLHMDPQYYTEPHKFDPERFLDNNHKPSPTYLPFGDGPRICIAMRFAILEMKICLAKLLSEYTVEINSKTQEPIQFDPYPYVPPRPIGGIWFNFKKRINKPL